MSSLTIEEKKKTNYVVSWEFWECLGRQKSEIKIGVIEYSLHTYVQDWMQVLFLNN